MSYLEQYEFRTAQNEFWRRCETAVLHCADSLSSESPGTDARRSWAAAAYQDPAAALNVVKNRIANHWRVVALGPAIPDAGEAPVLIGFLVTFQNEPTGKFWPLRSGRTTLGRSGADNSADVALADASTSARHAVIQGDPSTGQAFIEDAGSRNGTFINEQKLMPATQRQLHDNDRVRLGSITLVVKLLASA